MPARLKKKARKEQKRSETDGTATIVESGPYRLIKLTDLDTTAQPRTEYSEARLKELADSIREHGVLQPIVVRLTEVHVNGGTLQTERFTIIAGERRFRAAKKAGLKEIPSIIRESDQAKAYAEALVENIVREDLSALEVANALQSVMASGTYTQDDLGKKLGVSQPWIANKLRLLGLDGESKTALESGKINEAQAKALLSVSPEQRDAVLKQSQSQKWTSRELEQQVAGIKQRERADLQYQDSFAKQRVAVIAHVTKALDAGQHVFAQQGEAEDDQVLHKNELPDHPNLAWVESTRDLPTEYDLKFGPCKTCPIVGERDLDDMKTFKAISVSFGLRIVKTCGNVAHFELLKKQEKAGEVGRKKKTQQQLDRGRTAVRKKMSEVVLSPDGKPTDDHRLTTIGLRVLLYAKHVPSDGYSSQLSASALALVRRSGGDAKKASNYGELWEAVAGLNDSELVAELTKTAVNEVIQLPPSGGTGVYLPTDKHLVARTALFEEAEYKAPLFTRAAKKAARKSTDPEPEEDDDDDTADDDDTPLEGVLVEAVVLEEADGGEDEADGEEGGDDDSDEPSE